MAVHHCNRRRLGQNVRKHVDSVIRPRLESLEARQLLAADGVINLADEPIGIVQGFKWQDDNSNGAIDRGEPGLAGVTIYADLNENGRFEQDEPWTRTQRDDPQTRVDETGHYELIIPHGGEFTIREVVPNGFVQTFPGDFRPHPEDGPNEGPNDDPNDGGDEQFAEMHPEHLQFELAEGEEFIHPVEVIIHPFCIVPVEIDIVSQDPDVHVRNLSGVQLNGCGGDVSTFEILFVGDGRSHEFSLVAVDANSGHELDFSTVHITAPGGGGGEPGGHIVVVEPGQIVEGIDFGNHRIDSPRSSNIEGRKWSDSNGNGIRDENERGLGGVTIYLDLNANGQLDRNEPRTETRHDDPWTDFDEAGFYSFNVRPGDYLVREVVPRGFQQTFPSPSADVVSSETGRFDSGVALDLDVTGVEWKSSDDGEIRSTVDVTVVWPDTCGQIDTSATSHVVIGDHILIDLHGMQVGDACAEVISPQTQAISVPGLESGPYTVVATLHEMIPRAEDPDAEWATLGVVSEIMLGASGAHHVTVETGDVVQANFGNQHIGPAASLSGTKWLDTNGNGVREDNEPGLPGVTIYLDINFNGSFDEGEPTAVTAEDDPNTRPDETGRYAFSGVEPGLHVISEVVPDGYRQTYPWEIAIDPLPGGPLPPFIGQSHFVEVGPGDRIRGLDFGNQTTEPGSVHGTKWRDENGNSQRDPGEPGIAGVTIYADLNFNGQLDEGEPSTVTMDDVPETDFDEAGMYWLDNVGPGHTAIREIVPDGFMQTFPSSFILFDEPFPEFPFPEFPFPEAHYVNVIPGQATDGVDFGNQKIEPSSIHGTKWLDENGNGQRDRGEPGLAGVTIYLDLNFNAQHDDGEPHAVTMDDIPGTEVDETGMYWLEDVQPGFYHLREIVPDGFVQTFPFDFHPSPFDPPPGEPFPMDLPFPEGQHFVFVGSGETLEGFDFGNRKVEPLGVIEGVKWNDRNGDAVRQDDEPGLAGVTIFADLNLNGELDRGEPTAVTGRDNPDTIQDESGRYSLLVPPGEILVLEIVPRGFQQIHPSPFRRVAFPFNLGHVVNLPPGGEVDGVDFGNQRDESERGGSIAGTKWIDFNANGIREDDEPAEPGVTIYVDANNNGVRDRGEQSTITQRDNPDTEVDETGQYLFRNLAAGRYIVREELPFGFAQSFPNLGISVDATSQPLSNGHAMAYELVGANLAVNEDGQLDVHINFEVTWPDGCGSIIDSATEVTFDGQFVHIASTGEQFDGFCTLAIETESQTVTLEGVEPGDYGISAVLMEQLRDGTLIESFVIEGKFTVHGEDSHVVELQDGMHLTGLDFGNFPVPVPADVDFDVNRDGTIDDLDIDALAAAMNNNDEAHDLDFTQDGSIDQADRDYLIESVLNTVYGDSNLDGLFNSSDLVAVFQSGEYEDDIVGNSTWAEGDWDGDGDFTTSDLVFVFQKNSYSHAAIGGIDAAVADRIWSQRTG